MVRSIRTKLILSFLLISLLLSAVSMYGYHEYVKQGQRLTTLANEDIYQLQSILQLNYLFGEKTNSAWAYFNLQDKVFEKKIANHSKSTDKLLNEVIQKNLRETDIEKQKRYANNIKLLTELNKKYDTKLKQMIQARNEGNELLCNQRYQETDSIAVQIGLAANAWASEVEKEVNNEILTAERATKETQILTIIFIIISTLAAIAVGLYLGIRTSHPIKLLSETTQYISQGDLSINLPKVKNKDEVGLLHKNFGQLLSSLQTLIREMSSTSSGINRNAEVLFENTLDLTKSEQHVRSLIEEVDTGMQNQSVILMEASDIIGQLNMAIEQIASGTYNQTQQITRTSEVVNSMADSINEVATYAIEVKKAAEDTFSYAQKGEIAVGNSIKGMESIKIKVLDTEERIQELGQLSKQIGSIIQVIDDIADQTNLLALNAAIEAARAGVHGKGFAVVANEVRNLAEKSSDATKEIAQLINNIQTGTKKLIISMEEGSKEVEKGESLAQDAGNTLKDIINTMNLTLKKAENISISTKEIAESSASVADSIQHIACISQESSASTQEMTASSQLVVNLFSKIESDSRTELEISKQTSSSVEEMNRSVHEISGSANELSKMARKLETIVNGFKLP